MDTRAARAGLTDRECSVLRLLRRGMSPTPIAARGHLVSESIENQGCPDGEPFLERTPEARAYRDGEATRAARLVLRR